VDPTQQTRRKLKTTQPISQPDPRIIGIHRRSGKRAGRKMGRGRREKGGEKEGEKGSIKKPR